MLALFHALAARVRGFLRRDDLESDFDQEMAAHLDMAEADGRRRGLSPDEARRAARVRLGGITQLRESSRAAWGLPWLDGFAADLKLGGRMLVKYPGLTIVGGLGMAFAIWVGLVMFQVMTLIITPTLPLSEAARLVEIRTMDRAVNDDEPRVLHDFLQWRQSLRSLTEVGAWRNSSRNLIVAEGDASPITVAEISASAFRVATGSRCWVARSSRPTNTPPRRSSRSLATTSGVRDLAAIQTSSAAPCSSAATTSPSWA